VTASYHIDSDWGVGFVVTVTVTNNSTAAISNWKVGWTFAGNQKVTNAWNVTWTQSGATFSGSNMPYNGSLAPGASTTFGFQGTYSGSNAVPSPITASGS
jgi:cellulase/cellobiase CelA1